MPSSTAFSSTIDLNATDNESIDIDDEGKLRIKPEWEEELNKVLAQHEIELIELQANGTITPVDHDTLISDTFSDSTGYENTVNTGNTTATFDTNKYKRVELLTSNTTTNGNVKLGGDGAGVYIRTQSFEVASATSIKAISTYANAKNGTGTFDVRIETDNAGVPSGTLVHANAVKQATIASASGSGAEWIITFDTAFAVSANTRYHIVFKTSAFGVNDYVQVTRNSSSSYANGNMCYATQAAPTAYTAEASNDMYFKVYGASGSKLIEIDLPALTGTITHTQLVVNAPERETGDGVTYKLIDSAANNDASLATDTKNALVNCIGTNFASGAKLQITLDPKSSNASIGYPSVKSFALKIWKA